jgi:hypothetical protein
VKDAHDIDRIGTVNKENQVSPMASDAQARRQIRTGRKTGRTDRDLADDHRLDCGDERTRPGPGCPSQYSLQCLSDPP